MSDIEKLLLILHRLVDNGHSVFVIEHHPDILRQADWLIELGPEGGPKGGQLIFEGSVSNMLKRAYFLQELCEARLIKPIR